MEGAGETPPVPRPSSMQENSNVKLIEEALQTLKANSGDGRGKMQNIGKDKETMDTLQGINISHLGKRKIIFKMPFLVDMLVPRVVLQGIGMMVFFIQS